MLPAHCTGIGSVLIVSRRGLVLHRLTTAYYMRELLQGEASPDATQQSTGSSGTNGGGSVRVHIQTHRTRATAVQHDCHRGRTATLPTAPPAPSHATTPPTDVALSMQPRAGVARGGRPRVTTAVVQPTARRSHWTTAEPVIPMSPTTSRATIGAAAAAVQQARRGHHLQHHAARLAGHGDVPCIRRFNTST